MARPDPTAANSRSANAETTNSAAALRDLLDRYLQCPDEEMLGAFDQALLAYQTSWIRERAGVAPQSASSGQGSAAKPAARAKKPKFPIASTDLDCLRKIAEGWVPTTAEVPRWAWFETRELVTLQPNPNGDGSEILVLTEDGLAAIS